MVALLSAAIALALSACGGASSTSSQPSHLPLRSVADVPLAGGTSRLDYQSIDLTRNRLYISHLGADTLEVFDLTRQRLAASIGGVPGVHGVLVAPAIGRVYAAATDAQQLVTIDERTGSVLRRVPAGIYPDGIAYDPADREVFVSDEVGGTETVADALTGQRLGSVRLGGEAGNVQYDGRSGLVLVDVQSRDQLVAINPRRRVIVARYPLPHCDNDHGLQLDPARRLAYIACDHNAALLVFDLELRRVTARFTVGATPDVLDLDTELHRLYVAAESGVIAVFAERGRTLTKLGQGFLAPDAHSVAVDPRTHLVYFPLQDLGGRPVLRIMRATGARLSRSPRHLSAGSHTPIQVPSRQRAGSRSRLNG
jgi:DNA-binding beta-propeller fold protein YncE